MDGSPDLGPEQDCTGAPDNSVHDGQHAGDNVGLGGFPGIVLVMLQPEQSFIIIIGCDVIKSGNQAVQ